MNNTGRNDWFNRVLKKKFETSFVISDFTLLLFSASKSFFCRRSYHVLSNLAQHLSCFFI